MRSGNNFGLKNEVLSVWTAISQRQAVPVVPSAYQAGAELRGCKAGFK